MSQNIINMTESPAHIHRKLISFIGPDNGWIDFTETALHYIPELASRGRPPQKVIDESFVGKLGFKSFGDYLKTPREQGGIGLDSSNWKRFKEAYAIVKKHPWLRESGLKADQVRALDRVYGKNGTDDWPDSLEEHEHKQKEKAEEKRAEIAQKEAQKAALLQTLPVLQNKVETLQKTLSGAQEDIERLNRELGAANAKYQSASTQLSDLQSSLDQSNLKLNTKDQEIAALNDELKLAHERVQRDRERIQSLQSQGIWDHIQAIWRLILSSLERR